MMGSYTPSYGAHISLSLRFKFSLQSISVLTIIPRCVSFVAATMDMNAAIQMVIGVMGQTLSDNTAEIKDGEGKLNQMGEAPGFGTHHV